ETEDMRLCVDVRIQCPEPRGCELCLRFTDVRQCVKRLAMEIGGLEPVRIHQAQSSDACACEVRQHRNAKPTTADDEHTAAPQACLALRTDFLQCHLPRVVGHDSRSVRLIVRMLVMMPRRGYPMVVRRLRIRDSRAALAIDPARVAVLVMLLLP